MKLSIHTVAKDAIRLDYHLEQMLTHHVGLADEIIVMEGYSTDATYERICDIDPKIRIVREPWDATDSYLKYVEKGRKQCSGDWCLKLDADEFIPEWEWDRLRNFLRKTSDTLIPIQLRNFYGNYKVEHTNAAALRWPLRKWCIHPNRPDIEFWGDASNARIVGDSKDQGRGDTTFEVHHFGAVRHASRLREKWRTQAIRNQTHSGKYKGGKKIKRLPSWLFHMFPHQWFDPDIACDLAIYEGPYMRVVEDNPDEFVRDNFKVYKQLQRNNVQP